MGIMTVAMPLALSDRHDAHHDGRHAVGLERIFVQLLVELSHLLTAGVLVVEDLHDLEAAENLLRVAVYIADRGLLLEEVFAAVPHHKPAHHHHEHGDDQHDERQRQAEVQHDRKGKHQRNDGGYHHGQALRYELPERVYVVRVDAHDVAVIVRVEVADGQALHPHKEVVAYLLERLLSHDGDDPVVEQRCQRPDKIDRGHYGQYRDEAREQVLAGLEHLQNVVVYYDLYEQRADHGRHGARQYTDNDEGKLSLVPARYVCHETRHRVLCRFTHRRRLLSAENHRPPDIFCLT